MYLPILTCTKVILEVNMNNKFKLSLILILLTFSFPIINADFETNNTTKNETLYLQIDNGSLNAGQSYSGYFATYAASKSSTQITLKASYIQLHAGITLRTRTRYQMNEETLVRLYPSTKSELISKALFGNEPQDRQIFEYVGMLAS